MAVCCNGGFAALVCEREVGILWAAPVCAFGLGLRGTLQEYRGTYGTRERNLLALPTLDMYLPLSKFESIQRVSLTLRCNNNFL